MAGCALVAAADGEISLSERTRLDDMLESIERLSLFDVHDAVDIFDRYAHILRTEPERGRRKALEAVAAMADEPDSADLLIRLCLAVRDVDGDRVPAEREGIADVCVRLGRDPAAYLATDE